MLLFSVVYLARPERFELPTPRFVVLKLQLPYVSRRFLRFPNLLIIIPFLNDAAFSSYLTFPSRWLNGG